MRGVALLALAVAMTGCAGQRTHHYGYASDGYGIIDNSPHLPPPDRLMSPLPNGAPSR